MFIGQADMLLIHIMCLQSQLMLWNIAVIRLISINLDNSIACASFVSTHTHNKVWKDDRYGERLEISRERHHSGAYFPIVYCNLPISSCYIAVHLMVSTSNV